MIKCPKCGHKRTQNDDPLIPSTICPSCRLVFTKYRREPDKISLKTTSELIKKKYFDKQNVTFYQAILIILGFILTAIYMLNVSEKISGSLFNVFDKKPELSFFEMIKHPEIIKLKQKELCAWSKREEKRNPSDLNKIMKESYCKNN